MEPPLAMAARLLLETPDDVALAVACALADRPADLLRLGMACHHYRLKTVADPAAAQHDGGDGGSDAGPPPETWSIVSEAARRWVAACPAQQRGWGPNRPQDCWLGLLHELHELRQPPVFSRAAPQVTLMQVNGALQAGAAVATNAVPENDDPMSAAAASTVVLRVGQHFAQFTVRAGEEMHLGLIRPDYKLVQQQDSMDVDVEDVQGHCFFYTYNGWRYPGQRDWQGMQGKPRDTVARARVNDRIGLLLDFDTGSLDLAVLDSTHAYCIRIRISHSCLQYRLGRRYANCSRGSGAPSRDAGNLCPVARCRVLKYGIEPTQRWAATADALAIDSDRILRTSLPLGSFLLLGMCIVAEAYAGRKGKARRLPLLRYKGLNANALLFF
jgi:hypothetical protein